ncbi:MAG TPA: hypothetical protein PLU53_11665, partial [Bacteroidia bacterium]|nr:hypothetical protein [Bacteroidia bacterium]
LDGFISDSFRELDFGLLADIQQNIFDLEKLDFGLNAGASYGLSSIYDQSIYPLGGRNGKQQKAQHMNIYFGVYIYFKIQKE